jgi:hypothetical protein
MTPQQIERLVKIGNVLRRYGLLVIIITATPAALILGSAAVPETFRPLRQFEKPGSAALASQNGPADGSEGTRYDRSMPETVKGIYITTSTAAWKKRLSEIVGFVDTTEINALVIDVKDGNGRLAFTPTNEALKPYASARPDMPDLKAFTAPLKEKGIYLIARIFVFQDSAFAEARTDLALKWADGSLWRDNKGIPWLDAAAKDVWKYNVSVAKEVIDGGFDEVQFDYIRFPSDGKTSAVRYPFWDGVTPKHEVMRQFFTYLDRELRVKHGIHTSADLFGFTMVYHDYDLNIGQLLADALPHFDAISPMVYPSHYPNGYLGFGNPAEYPYEIVAHSMAKGNELLAKMTAEEEAKVAENPKYVPATFATFRPWLQDFDLGADYDAAKIQGQIRASDEEGASGWIFWNARNVYNEPAYHKE